MCLAHLAPVSLGRMEENDKPAEQVRRVLFGKQPRWHGIIGDCMLPHIYSTFEVNMSRNALEPERTAHIPRRSGEFRRGFAVPQVVAFRNREWRQLKYSGFRNRFPSPTTYGMQKPPTESRTTAVHTIRAHLHAAAHRSAAKTSESPRPHERRTTWDRLGRHGCSEGHNPKERNPRKRLGKSDYRKGADAG